MEKPAFYDKEKAQSREDFFRDNALTASYVNDFFFELIHEGVSVGAKILDIGTGNAFILEQLASRHPKRYGGLYGIDLSPEMLEKARERISGLDIQLFLGDNMDLPFQEEFFDAVTAKNVTNFSESEVYRAMPEARAIIHTHGRKLTYNPCNAEICFYRISKIWKIWRIK